MEKKVIGVYAPANAAHIWFEEKYLFAKKQLENMGFEIVEGNLVKNKIYQGYRTASAKERAEEMMNLVKNKDEEEYKFEIELVGEYNLYNVLGCVASALSLGVKIDFIVKKLQEMPSVPGRFETIKNDLEARIVIDFAHTDDGLLNIGKTLKQITDNQVITIFGAGGDRDHDKRPKMAKAATKFSDYIILTSDNPRTENPIKILADIEKGLIAEKYPFDKYIIIADREKAIRYGMRLLKKGDSLLIAGKGHETYQIIGTEKTHFDDREVVRKILAGK